MAIIFMDGCDQHDSTTDIEKRWNFTNSTSLQPNGPWSGEQSITLSTRNDFHHQTAFNPPVTAQGEEMYCGFWQKMGNMTEGRRNWIDWRAVNGMEGSDTNIDGRQYLLLYDSMGCIWGNGAGWCSAPVLKQYRWQWIEIRILMHDTTGEIEIYVDGNQVVSETGLNTTADVNSNDTIGALSFSGISRFQVVAKQTSWNDFIVWDDTGSTMNSFPIGPQRISTLKPDAEGTTSQFTPQSGTDNALMVDEAGGPDTGTYSQSGTVGHIDMYTCENMPFTPTTVNAVQVSAHTLATSTTDREFKLKADDGTTIGASGDMQTPNDGVAYWQHHIWEVNPTGAAWNETTVNGMEIGIEVVT